MAGDRDPGLAAGMDDYIRKPVEMPELAEAIKRQLAMFYSPADEVPPARRVVKPAGLRFDPVARERR
jgi:DNA-binding response OmpR family regulator